MGCGGPGRSCSCRRSWCRRAKRRRPPRPGVVARWLLALPTSIPMKIATSPTSMILLPPARVVRPTVQALGPVPRYALDLNLFVAGRSPYQRIPSPGCRGRLSPPDHLRTEARHHAHSNWLSPRHLSPGTTNKVTDTGMPLFCENMLDVCEAVKRSGIGIPVAGSRVLGLYWCVRLVLVPLRYNLPQVLLAVVAGVS